MSRGLHTYVSDSFLCVNFTDWHQVPVDTVLAILTTGVRVGEEVAFQLSLAATANIDLSGNL